MTHYTLTLLALLLTTMGAAQNDFASLENKADEALLNEDYQKALHFMKRSEQLLPKQLSPKEKAEFYNNLGIAYYETGAYKKGIDRYIKALEYYRILKIDTLIAESLYNLGVAYKDLGVYDKSVKNLLQAARIFEKYNCQLKLSSAWNSVGNVYRSMKSYSKAVNYHNRALVIRKRIDYKKGVADSYQNLGNVYLEWGKFGKAELFLIEALQLKKANQQPNIVTTYSSLGQLYNRLGQTDKALPFLTKAYELRLQDGNSIKTAESLYYLATYYASINDHKKALDLFLQVEQIARFNADPKLLAQALEGEITLIEQNQIETILVTKYRDLNKALEQSANDANRKEVDRLEIKYDVQRKTRELNIRRKQTKIDQLKYQQLLIVLVGVALLTISIAIAFYKVRRSKLFIEQQKKKIEYLHHELSHRTGNYFGLLSGILKIDRKKAKHSESIKILNDNIHRLEAMELVQHYLFDDSSKENKEVELGAYFSNLVDSLVSGLFPKSIPLQFTGEFDFIHLDYHKAMQLAIVLNELICNSIEHGLLKADQPALKVIVIEKEGILEMTVSDNGPGISNIPNTDKSKGLNLMSHLLQMVNGTISYQNNNGCIISVTAPL